MDALQALYTRRSCRKYTSQAIPQKDLDAILEAGRQAPTGGNRQGWRFVVVSDPDMRQKVSDCTGHGKFLGTCGAAVCVFTSEESFCPHEDANAATTCMMVAAHALGYATCWIGNHQNPCYGPISELLGAPEGWRMMTLFALGKPEGPLPTPEKKPLTEVVSYNGF